MTETAIAQARLLAIEVLLADPESLGNDALEADLYLLRERLREAGQEGSRSQLAPAAPVT